uniref:CMP/dCMP-type deaminase domain-containing protein n=1 Tax=Ananas comosus var. bracteatus TaxID=296719 RepID=A0A6V7QST3_ANACO
MGEEKITDRSTAEMALPGFVISAEEAAGMAAERGAEAVEELLRRLSGGDAAGAGADLAVPGGRGGAGIERARVRGREPGVPGLPLHHSVHAEQFLVANAAAAGEAGIRCIAVSHMPCGHCRQFLQELRAAPEIRILVTSDGPAAAFRPLSALLPRPFGPPDLLHKDVPLLLEPHDNDLGPAAIAAAEDGVEGAADERLRAAAEAAARAAYAPYSGCAAGFAVADAAGRVHAGAYAESAAYNPSLGPVQAAMVAMTAAEAEAEAEVAAAALVEKEGAAVSHEATARIFLAAVAPRAHLRVYRFRPSDQA